LGGFTSIVLEGSKAILSQNAPTIFTTSNTLTVAYIVKGVEEAIRLRGRKLNDCGLLIIGSTGDIGSGCTYYLADKVKALFLCARNSDRLQVQQRRLCNLQVESHVTTSPAEFLPVADIVICAASVASPAFSLRACKTDAVICDAGYPKNIQPTLANMIGESVFFGGMGRVLGGLQCEPDLRQACYGYPLLNIAHGCMLEGVLLALEGRHEVFSQGRGNIKPTRVEEIWQLAQKHSFVLSPFFNQRGLWAKQPNDEEV